MYAEPVKLTLTLGDRKSKPIKFDLPRATFRLEVLEDPGKYYPPKLPISSQTPLSVLYLTKTIPIAEVSEFANGLREVLDLEWEKLNFFIENELWEQSKQYSVASEIPGGGAEFSIQKLRPCLQPWRRVPAMF